ncbi:MAG: protein translocase subunit SecD [Candidatus Doudnabacteria bacterium]|nr:protein translocase subunit SecD [Candidatus Doudnabacteria bacterium]
MTRTRLYLKLVVIILLAAAAFYIVLPIGSKISLKPIGINFEKQYELKLGLDLQGGTHLVYEGDLKGIPEDARTEAMSSARDVIERRVNAFGVSEPLVQVSGQNRLIIELPGITNIDAAIDQIGQTPFMEFREENPNPKAAEINEDGEVVLDAADAFLATGLTGKEFERAALQFHPTSGQPQISLQFNSEGTKKFAEITQRNVNKRVAIFLDGAILSAPVVQSAITNGEAVITGQFTVNEAKELVTRLNSGALPVPIKLIQQQNVGASLGQSSIDHSLTAGIIGMVLIALFMMVYYRLPGLLATAALIIYAALTLAVFKILGVTLSLAGIAGFILSIGMAVDANILIFERLKEELKRGKSLDRAVEEGFDRAWLSIRDSNFSSLITTFILGYFGTSIIRGFAITLSIGILVSMFTAIILSRTFLRILVRFNSFSNQRLYGVKRHA